MANPRRNAFLLCGCIVILAAAGLRLFDLGGKVIHADESVQAWKTGELLQNGDYRYDPEDHHGPTLYYLAAGSSWLLGERAIDELAIGRLRLVPAFAGIALVLLTLGFAGVIGGRAALLAGAFTATSPLLIYYSRHFIQESLLVLFSCGAIMAGWRWQETHRLRWAARTGAFLGLMAATKETWLLHAGALGIAWLSIRPRASESDVSEIRPRPAMQFAVAALAWLGVTAILYSSFFTQLEALVDVGRGIVNGISRAGDSVHAKPWYTYLHLLLWSASGPYHWSEAAIFLFALVALPAIRARRIVRFLAVYAGTLLVAYSVIPYKTPWLACGFWHAFAMLAGCGAARLLGPEQPHAIRTAAGTLLILVLAQLGWQAHRAAGPLAGNSRNPYGYVETSRDILRLPSRLESIAAVHPEGHALHLTVAIPQVWPLPWLLRDYPHVRYGKIDVSTPEADVMLVSPGILAGLSPATLEHLQTEYFGLREGEFVVLAVENELWERSLAATQSPP